jgi:two-component system nitrate/nitrite response regulator NarL
MSAGARVVLCDDHQLFAESLAVVLATRGHDVVAVTMSPPAAATAVVEHDAELCIMDMNFPAFDGNGVDGARMVLEGRPGTAVVILSADNDPPAFARAMATGVTGFARKDQDVSEVLAMIDRVLAGHVVIDPALLRAAVSSRNRPLTDVERMASFLTAREREVLDLLTQGCTTERIAERMGVAYSTARTHIQNVLAKLGVHSRLEASALAVAHGLHRAG